MNAPRKKKIVFVYRNDFQKRLFAEIAQGRTVPTDFLYGMHEIDRTRFDVEYVVAPRGQRRTVAAWLGWFLEKPFTRIVKVGIPIEIYPMFRQQIHSADVLICANDAVSFGILFWKWLGWVKADVFVLLHGLPERVKYFEHRKAIRWFIRKLLAQASHVFTVSDNGHEPLYQKLGLPRARITTFHFGVAPEFWKPSATSETGNYVLSVGNDTFRDYDTLIEAMAVDREVIVVTKRQLNPRGRQLRRLDGLSDVEVRDLYQRAKYVVIPSTRLTYQPSGMSVCLQAMACGKATILPDNPSLREVFTEGEHCLYYEPESPDSLRDVCERLDGDPDQADRMGKAASRYVRGRFTTGGMARIIMSSISE